MDNSRGARRFRMAVSAIALLSLNVQPVLAQSKGKDAALNVCSAQREPLVKVDTEYKELKRSKMSAAVGEGIKQGATVLAKGVMSGGIPLGGRGGGGGGFGGMGGMAGMMGGMASMAAASQAQKQQAAGGGGPAPSASASTAMFGQDLLSGAMGLNVPGVSGARFGGGGGDSMKAYAALAVLVAIVATAEAYAQLKEQEAGGDLRKASFNIDQDAARQLAVTREIVNNGNALVECRSAQLTDINNRMASASNDKDRKAIKRERTELVGALKKDVDLTGGVVEQHTGMAKTFTQGRAMTDGSSESEVLGGQAPAYATAASVTKLSMPKPGQTSSGSGQQQASAPAAAAGPMVAIRATAVRAAPTNSAASVKALTPGTEVKPAVSAAEGGWWEVEVNGQTGYVKAADLGPPGSVPAPVQTAGKGKGKGGAPATKAPPAAPAGPSNIRAYNQTVIAARDSGKGRLSSLMTDIQTSERKENVFYALLASWGLA